MMRGNKYDLLRDTWIYQEIQQLVREEEHEHVMMQERHALLTIVRARFPRLNALAEEASLHAPDAASLRTLLVNVGSARTERAAREHLNFRNYTPIAQ